MKTTLIQNIRLLAGIRQQEERLCKGSTMQTLHSIAQAFLLLEGGKISAYGPMAEAPDRADEVIDGTERAVLPAWCDSHTHIVYAGSREREFEDKIRGLSYQEIAARGGGILNSAALLHKTDESALYDAAVQRLEEIKQLGSGAVEIKSGYGLSMEGELKMLRVIRKLKERSEQTIRATFLGAHAYPKEFQHNHRGYLDLLLYKLLPLIADEGLADFIDVFCEEGYFSVADLEEILEAGAKWGLPPKVHVNQFTSIGGVETCVKYRALSVDHLELMSAADIVALQNSDTMPVALPGCSFFLRIPYTPARQLLQAGLPLALASDYNPGSSPSGNMNLVLSLACIQMQLTPEEAINAATLNGAYAMGVEKDLGSITIGKKANLILTKKIPSLAYLPYSFGSNSIERVLLSK